jgi:DNA polymerase
MGGVPAASASADAEGAGGKQGALESIAQEAAACTRCSLATTRNRVVPGQGNPDAAIMFVGEAPGADEDQQGLAFVGRAGQLLTRMIEAMGLQREDVFIANVLKCRPPGNRDPQPDEVVSCSPFLERQLAVVRPRVVVALGGHAMKSLLGSDATVGRMRGAVHDYRGTPLVVTYHPAYLLRSPAMKKPAWDDLKLALKVIGREPPQRGLGGRPD